MSRGKSLAYKPGAGETRDYWAIKRWLHDRKLTLGDIAAALELTSIGLVSATIRGVRNNRRVLQWFLNNECPADILSLPDDMKSSEDVANAIN